MTTHEKDYIFGSNNELEILQPINKFFNRKIYKSNNRYSKYDYFDGKYNYELKSLRRNKNSFDTVIIQVYKCTENTILLFNFFDGLYYIEYDVNKFSKYEQKYYQRKRENVNDINYLCYFIPVSELTVINEYSTELDF
jgi:hypothetical protein